MKTEVVSYVRRKVKEDFEKCCWEDGVGKKFEEISMREMLQSLDELEDELEETRKFFRNVENILTYLKLQ